VETLLQQLHAHPGLLTLAEVSDLFGFHEVSLRNWVRAGTGNCHSSDAYSSSSLDDLTEGIKRKQIV
jgi:hypothetical protein